MELQTQALEGGFEATVFGAQATFRALMEAMARPGTIQECSAECAPPVPLGAAQGAVALTLCDHDTPVWLSPKLAHALLTAWIGFHTGAELVSGPSHAVFAFLASGEPLPDFHGFAMGSQDYPDRSATLVIELPALTGGERMIARGPGIKACRSIAPVGLPGDFLRRWKANRALFPRGIDLVLTSGKTLLALPRSTELTASGD